MIRRTLAFFKGVALLQFYLFLFFFILIYFILKDEAGDTPLYDAIASEKHNMVDMLMNNPRLSMTVTNKRGFNYLQYAVLKGNTRYVIKI